MSTGWAPESTRSSTGGSGLVRAYCTRSCGTVQGILNRQDALVPSSPSFVVLLGSAEQWQVANDSPGYSWDAEVEFVISRARRVKTVNLEIGRAHV